MIHPQIKKPRPAFSLVELLVVLAVIMLIISMLLPAIQRTREAANRARCINNLHQIGLALQHYEGVFGHLPPARWHFQGASWLALILPHMEEDSIYQRWDLTKTYYEQSDEARLSTVKNYFCPTRRHPTDSPKASLFGDVPSTDLTQPHVPGALCDYAGSLGSTDIA